MITFESVSKRFGNGPVVVDNLDLAIEAGELVVLVGPSGCGKTTTLRMINRLDDLSEGRISVNGEDIMAMDRIELRRGIGYVMQHSGLFPHRTISDNIATMPNLLGWDKARTRARVEELIGLVGLPPELAERYPHQLSGGQQQRVGVARALAADPPLMLMDEPFAAVDPIVRTRLQDEFLRLQRQVKKTIVFVTHDIDEAIKIGDRIAMFETGGSLAQYATPTDMLAAPVSEFVSDFLGPERELKRLALIPVSDIEADPGPVVGPGDSPDSARDKAGRHRTDWVVVVGPEGRLRGWVRLAELDGVASMADCEAHPFDQVVSATDSLRAALNAMVASNIGVAPRLGPNGSYEGLLTQEGLSRQLS